MFGTEQVFLIALVSQQQKNPIANDLNQKRVYVATKQIVQSLDVLYI